MPEFTLPEPSPDPLLDLIGAYKADTRRNKIDLGVGVYRDDQGNTPVLAAVKIAERQLLEQQNSKSYLGLTGDIGFVDKISDLVFGENAAEQTGKSIAGAQTPGGSGALRVAFELYDAVRPDSTLWIGVPTWPNHLPLAEAAGLKTRCFDAFCKESQTILFDSIIDSLSQANSGDSVLLHGCCHNPTGADLTFEQIQTLCGLINDKGLIPIVDLAYHGLGRGLQDDLQATREIIRQCPHTLVATSCSKNFGLYRDRVGAVYIATDSKTQADNTQAYFGHIARRIYSMPPDHGAAVVGLILGDAELTRLWLSELETMAQRINTLRQAIATQNPRLSFVGGQQGMFSLLPLNSVQVDSLINDHAVYLAGDGRINIAGCQLHQVEQFCQSLSAVGFEGL